MGGMARNIFTVESAKHWLRDKAERSGGICPVCNRFTKVYRRQITSSMARFLIEFWKEWQDFDYHHVAKNYRRCGDYAKLHYWGLMEPRGDRPDAKKTSGYWRITPDGLDFIRGDFIVPRFARVYDGHVLGYDGQDFTISDALGEGFNYEELMA